MPQLPFAEDTISGIFQYCRGSVVYSQGDEADGVLYVVSGVLLMSIVSDDGKEAVVEVVGAGDFLGEECLVDKAARSCSAVAIDTCTLMRIERANLLHALKSPDFSHRFMRHLLGRNAKMRDNLAEQIFSSSERRLLLSLLSLSQRDGRYDGHGARLPRVSQSTLASMVGTTRSRISYFLGRFRKMGLVYNEHGIRINVPMVTDTLRGQPAAQPFVQPDDLADGQVDVDSTELAL